MSPNPAERAAVPVPAAEANEAIRRFVRARRDRPWTAQDRVRYVELLETWTLAVRGDSSSGAA
ncbi:hypothetical protein [Streptomyces sp. NPDC003077]|uniref:hypothetical protein n=1 Tax=Streptomyces sp. NPDC003077 TaxID=3154443 RepID=UPI0033AE4BE3